MSTRNRPAAKTRRHPARDSYASEVRELGLRLLSDPGDDVMVQHASAALWIAANGRVYTRQDGPLPPGISPGAPGKCFANAQDAARSHGRRYAEGFAGPSPAGRWTLHAWNVDHRGHVIDPTWAGAPGPQGRYLGVEFGSLPEGDDAGISLVADLIGGTMISLDPATGRVRLLDGDSAAARMVIAQGGTAFVASSDPKARHIKRALREASPAAR